MENLAQFKIDLHLNLYQVYFDDMYKEKEQNLELFYREFELLIKNFQYKILKGSEPFKMGKIGTNYIMTFDIHI